MTAGANRDARTARGRLRALRAGFALALLVMAGRLVDLALEPQVGIGAKAAVVVGDRFPTGRRTDIVDRNGVLLATDYPKVSVFADPAEVIDPAGSAARLAAVLRGVDVDALRAMLERPRRFVWVKRHIGENEQRAVIRLGLPGIKFRTEHHRVYPQGRLTSHVVGFVGVENQALAGVERSFEQRLRGAAATAPLALTIDVRVQEVVRSALSDSVERFQAKGGSALVVEAGTGDVLAMVSLPDFDPNRVDGAAGQARFNRNTQGSYELGSLFKLFTVARALDAGIIDIADGVDASEPFVFGRHRISDFHAKSRWLTVPEIIAFSSNIGAAKLANTLGSEDLKAYFQALQLFDRHPIRLPEVGMPQLPDPWRPINTVTAAYGHGIAVSPLQAVDALKTLLCGPTPPAHLVLDDDGPQGPAAPAVRPETGTMLRWLMWLTVSEGTGKGAMVPGYLVGGKTGSADQAGPGGYRNGALLSSFIGAFPMNAPRYLILVTLDDPEGDAATHFQAHGGWTAAPTVGRIIERIGPLTGIRPSRSEEERWFRDRLSVGRVFSRYGREEASFAVARTASFEPSDAGLGSCVCRPCSIPR